MHYCIFLLLVLQTICSTTCNFPVHIDQGDVWARKYKEIIGQDITGQCTGGETWCGSAVGCAEPCPSQFDAVPCDEAPELDVSSAITQGKWKKILYRITRPLELKTMTGYIFPKDANLQKNLNSHVGCGSRKGYKSQLISFTTSLDVAKQYYNKSPSGTRIVMLKKEYVEENTVNIFDLTTKEQREKLLKNPVFRAYAKRSIEVVLEPKTKGIPVITIEGPKK